MNLVVGSSGMLGGMVARRLLERGKPVRVMVRQPSAIQGAESVFGDLKDPASLEAACRGATCVITTANSAQRGGADNVTSVDLEGNAALIDAAVRTGVKRFVFVSAAFVDADSAIPFFAAKARTENSLRRSGLEWTILAPHVFLDVWFGLLVASAVSAGAPVSLVGGGKARHSFIAVNDVAEFVTRAADLPAAARQYFVLGGPEALSWSDIVAKTAAILGRPVPVRSIEAGQPIPHLPPPVNAVVGGLASSLEHTDRIIDSSEAARIFGVSLTPVDAVLRQLLAPA